MKFTFEHFDHALVDLMYVAICAGCVGSVLYVVATLATGQL